jgi:hypothetical protein
MALTALTGRRLPWLVVTVAMLMCAAMITNAIIAHNLVSALTV